MRIQHNIMAMSAYRNYTNNVSAMKQNLEKLSSGYKINRAGDDAAGLAISEKMRAQITGLETAQKNAKDGISLVQTAEGALTEVHDMLNRMVELATQSANGTYEDATDRAQLQKEVDQLLDEINRIADSSNFNGINLLDGSMAVSDAVEASTSTVTKDVSGMDRIITSVIDKGEKAYEVAGEKTILDGKGAPAQKASFEIDLSTMNFEVADAYTYATTVSTVGGATASVALTASNANSATFVTATDGAGATTGTVKFELNGDKVTTTTVTITNPTSTKATTAGATTGYTYQYQTASGATATLAIATSDTDPVSVTVTSTDGKTVTVYELANDGTVTQTKTETDEIDATKADASISDVVSVTVNGTKLSTLASGFTISGTATSNAAAIAEALVQGAAGSANATSATVKINGVDWNVTASGSKLKFEQVNVPQTADEARANFDVRIGIANGAGSNEYLSIDLTNGNTTSTGSGSLSMSASIKPGTYVATAGVAAEADNKADTIFNIKDSDITDGTQFAIGSKTVMLMVGDSKVDKAAATASGVVVVELNEGVDLNTALSKISEAIGSVVNFKILGTDGTMKDVQFQIGVSDSSMGFPSGLAVQRVNTVGSGADTGKDLAFDSLEKLAANFKMRVNETTTTEAKEAGKGLTLQIGDTADSYNQLTVSIEDCHADAMGIGDIDISTQEGAAAAVDKIKAAINYVSDVRGTLGATQNRLDHTINNLSVMTENIQDAESTIRDTDVAEEMMAYTKNNILIQSAQAMLAQANQVPQGVLQLLQ